MSRDLIGKRVEIAPGIIEGLNKIQSVLSNLCGLEYDARNRVAEGDRERFFELCRDTFRAVGEGSSLDADQKTLLRRSGLLGYDAEFVDPITRAVIVQAVQQNDNGSFEITCPEAVQEYFGIYFQRQRSYEEECRPNRESPLSFSYG